MRNSTLWKLALSLFLFSTASLADPPFSQSLDALLKQHELPGAVVMIKRGDVVIHHQAYGKVNVKQAKDMHRDALFRVLSQ